MVIGLYQTREFTSHGALFIYEQKRLDVVLTYFPDNFLLSKVSFIALLESQIGKLLSLQITNTMNYKKNC